MKHVVLYVGHLYKLFWTKKIWPGWQGGSKNVKIWPWMGLAFIFLWLRSLLEAPKWVKDPGNGLKSVRGSLGVHFEPVILIWTFPRVDGERWWWQWLIRIADSGVSDSQLTEQTWDLSRVEGALTASGRRPLLLSIGKTNRVQKKINFTRVMMTDEDSYMKTEHASFFLLTS